ncbi:bacteriorhodopsin [Halobacillus trueperi]|uniref:bacteriorhodopsin n=1 Tax=Halobacillus trueperi TaxID=156205 RepID=UPI0035ABBC0D
MTAFWICYPTAWIIGLSGVGWTQQATETTAFFFLPILSKFGFILLDSGDLRRLNLPSVDG